MLAGLMRVGLLTAVIAAVPAPAQVSSLPPETDSTVEPPAISPSRLAAGVREYPARLLRALLRLAEDPLVLRQLADEPNLLARPEDISPPVSVEMHAAIRELSVMPAIVSVSAGHPVELAALRELYVEAPEEMEERILQLRAAYDEAELEAAVAWQEALERDPAALGEYCELVTRFCKTQREAYEGFPCVYVLKREYYYACPPNEAIIFYAIEHADSSAAMRAIEQWWETYAPYELDARILSGNEEPADLEIRPDIVAALLPEQRASMWKAVEGDYGESVGLVPVIMQPPADQPLEARYAHAVAEHARLWTPEMPDEAPEEPSAGAYDEPVAVQWDMEEPTTAVVPDTIVEDAGTWLAEDQDEGVLVDGWECIEEPADEVVYDDDLWRYWSDWAHDPAAYPRVSYCSYHVHYAPIAVYYCGYPIDWPLFYGCDPCWLVRLRICTAYCRCGYGAGVRRSYHAGSRTTACFDLDGRARVYYGSLRRRGLRRAVRIGKRYYYHCAHNWTTHALRHRRTHHGRALSSRRPLTVRARLAVKGTVPDPSRRGTRQDVQIRHVSAAGVVKAPAGPVKAESRLVISRLRLATTSARQPTRSGIRPSILRSPTRKAGPIRGTGGYFSRGSARSGWVFRPSTSGRGPSNKANRVTLHRPTSSRSRIVMPPRSSAPRQTPSTSARRPTSSRPKMRVPRRSSAPRQTPSASDRRPARPKSKTATSPRRGNRPRRSPSVSPRRPISPRPKVVTPHRPTGPRPKVRVPRRSSAPRHAPSTSARRPARPKSKTVTSPRRGSSPRRNPSMSPRRPSSPRPKVVTPRRPTSSKRKSTVPSRRR